MNINIDNQSILVVDDSPITSQYLKQQLAAEGSKVHFADTAEAAKDQITQRSQAQEQLGLIILGADIDAQSGSDVLACLRQKRPQCPWISLIDCNTPAQELQLLLQARLQDQPLAVVAADNQSMLLAQVRSRLSQASKQTAINTLQAQLESIQQRFEHLLDTSSEAIAFVVSGCHLYANPSFLELVGMDSVQQLERVSLLELLVADDSAKPIKDCLRELEQGNQDAVEVSAKLHANANDTTTPVNARLQPASYGGEDCIQVTLTELPAETIVTADQNFPGYLPKQAFYQLSTESLQAAETAEQAHAVLCVRLDNFNEIQEQIGIINSELLTHERADLLRGCIDEEHDLLTHYSENLFLVKVTRVKRPAIEQLCKHIVAAFSEHLASIDDHSLPVTCSIGYTMTGRQNHDINTLILEAARAARQAEQSGGNCSQRYRPDLRSVEDDGNRNHWQERLRHALDNNELLLTTTQISDIGDSSRELVGIDICMHDDESDTYVHSEAWRQAIQGSGLRAELDRHMIRLTMQQPELLSKTLFLPICASDHDGKVLADALQASLKHANYSGEGLVLMLDSTDLATNMQPAVTLKRSLSSLPVHWGLDMFGATDNATQLLQHLQTEYTRLCASVLPKDGDKQQSVDKLTRLAACSNDAEIIACSVDNAAVVPTLWQAGIKLIQGEFIQQHPDILQA